MKQIFFFSILFSFSCAYAQTVDTASKRISDTSNSVIIHKDPRLDLLVKKQAQVNESTTRESKRTAKGFRLMIISTNNRDEALAAKTKIYTYFPDLKPYLYYQSPYFRLKAGNFVDRKDAEAYRKRVNSYFPKGVFIMPDVIEVKPAKEETDDDKNS